MKHPFYIVISKLKGAPYIVDRDLDGSEAEWVHIMNDMWSGELTDVQAIYLARPDRKRLSNYTLAAAKCLSSMSHALRIKPSDALASWIIAQGEDHFEPEITRAEYIDSISEDYAKERRFA